jgi:hypothetical protein
MIAYTAHRCIAGSSIKPPPKGKGAQYVFVGAPCQGFRNMFGWSARVRRDTVRYHDVSLGRLHLEKCHAYSFLHSLLPLVL